MQQPAYSFRNQSLVSQQNIRELMKTSVMYKGRQQWPVPTHKCDGIPKIPITKHSVMPEVYAYSIQQVMMKLT